MNKPGPKGGGALLLTFIFLAFSCPGAEPAKPSPSPSPTAGVPSLRMTYDSFRLVHTRNVFDPDRRPVRPANTAPVLGATRANYTALTGTLLSADKSYAFFSGSRPEFNRVLTVQEKIANATITSITGLNIEVERDGKRTTVAVGQTVPFDNQTAPGVPPVDVPPPAPTLTDGAPPASVSATTTTTTTTTATAPPAYSRQAAPGTAAAATSTAPKGPPSNLDEIRRRMMEKRQQELK